MHQFLVTFASLLLSLCHGSVFGHSTQSVADNKFVPSTLSFPDRRELARSSLYTGYPESACASCLRMNTSYITR